MADALLIIAQNHIVERHHILGIIVLNGQQIPELPGGCLLVGDTETHLDIELVSRFVGDKINLLLLQLSDMNGIPLLNQMQVNRILHHLVNIPSEIEASNGMADADILEVKLLSCFENLHAAHFGAGNPVNQIGIAQGPQVIQRHLGRQIHPLRLQKLADVIG